MNNSHDILSKEILKLIDESSEPLETKEIENELKRKTKDITRTRVFYRLMLLRGENLIFGKFVGSGKGVWIWWKKEDKK
jgi:repressor of nif and glnA expression